MESVTPKPLKSREPEKPMDQNFFPSLIPSLQTITETRTCADLKLFWSNPAAFTCRSH